MNDVRANPDCKAPVGPLNLSRPRSREQQQRRDTAGCGPQSGARVKHLLNLALCFTIVTEVLVRSVP